jgi:hypothetical protein
MTVQAAKVINAIKYDANVADCKTAAKPAFEFSLNQQETSKRALLLPQQPQQQGAPHD